MNTGTLADAPPGHAVATAPVKFGSSDSSYVASPAVASAALTSTATLAAVAYDAPPAILTVTGAGAVPSSVITSVVLDVRPDASRTQSPTVLPPSVAGSCQPRCATTLS